MKERMLEKKDSPKRRIIFTLLVALIITLSLGGNVYGGPSDDDGRNNSIGYIQKLNYPKKLT